MPAFTFEKISAPKKAAPVEAVPAVQKRSAVKALLDRMTNARRPKAKRNSVKFDSSTGQGGKS